MIINTKICSKCGQELPLTEFYKNRRYKDGLNGTCKTCDKKRANQYYQDHREEAKERSKKSSRERYHRVLKHDKQYKEQMKKLMKQYRDKNKERLRETSKQYRIKHREQMNELHKQWALENRERKSEYNKQWLKNNPDKRKILDQKRRARKMQLPATLTDQQWQHIKDCFNNQCAYCGKEKSLQQEHFIPVSKCGEYTHNNIIPSCPTCNQRKRDKDFFDWYPKQKFYSKRREAKILKFLGYAQKDIQQPALMI